MLGPVRRVLLLSKLFFDLPVCFGGRYVVHLRVKVQHLAVRTTIVAAPHVFAQIDIEVLPVAAAERAVHVNRGSARPNVRIDLAQR